MGLTFILPEKGPIQKMNITCYFDRFLWILLLQFRNVRFERIIHAAARYTRLVIFISKKNVSLKSLTICDAQQKNIQRDSFKLL